MNNLSPFEFFVKECTHLDVVVREEGMNNLNLICGLMGPDKVRSDLVPFIFDRLASDVEERDQVLLAMSKNMAIVGKATGGNDHLACLVPIIEALCRSEETAVRDAIATSTVTMLQNNSVSGDAAVAFVEMFERLSGPVDDGEDMFYPKYTAGKIGVEILAKATGAHRSAVLTNFSNLVRHEVLLVRHSAVVGILGAAQVLQSDVAALEVVFGFFTASLNDVAESVRVLATAQLCGVAKCIGQSTAAASVLPLVALACGNASWRVRQAVAATLSECADCFPDVEVAKHLYPPTLALLQDPEEDVRALACSAIPAFASKVRICVICVM